MALRLVRPFIVCFTLYNATKDAMRTIEIKDFQVDLRMMGGKTSPWRVRVVASKEGSVVLGCITDVDVVLDMETLKNAIAEHFSGLVAAKLAMIKRVMKTTLDPTARKNYVALFRDQAGLQALDKQLKAKNYDLDEIPVTYSSFENVFDLKERVKHTPAPDDDIRQALNSLSLLSSMSHASRHVPKAVMLPEKPQEDEDEDDDEDDDDGH